MIKTATKVCKCRLGQIDFINTLPIDYPLHKFLREKNPDFDFTIFCQVPSVLNKMLFNSELDLAPISSIEFLRHQDFYKRLANLSISSLKEADSVGFFSNKPITDFKKKPEPIYLTNQSETSINLFKLLLAKKYGFNLSELEFKSFGDDHHELENKLLIGDEALIEERNKWEFFMDLGLEWYEFTNGLPMVFGLWTARKEYELKSELIQLLDNFKTQGLGELLPDVIVAAYAKTGISKKDLYRYFSRLNYDFTNEHKKSLDLFQAYLLDLKLL